MIKLGGRTRATGLAGRRLRTDVWRVCAPGDGLPPGGEPIACLVVADEIAIPGYGMYLTAAPGAAAPGPVIHLGPDLAHLAPGDIIQVADDGGRVAVLWKATARHNSLLLTEQCDNYCLMCSQPPKARDDSWLFDRARKVISLLPAAATSVGFTGGEPTLPRDGTALLGLLEHCAREAPQLAVHLLSNGRRFADFGFARAYGAVGLADIMAGIPVYAPEPGLHDYIVQAEGAFTETIHGILNLATLGQCVEIRVVIQKHTVPVLADLAAFVARNLPFIDQVALMGLEMTGLARPNSTHVWIDPADYQEELSEAVYILASAGIDTKVFNHQLCVLDRSLWPYAVQSISDWKNSYLDICQHCAVRDQCGGVFATSGNRLSRHLQPLQRR